MINATEKDSGVLRAESEGCDHVGRHSSRRCLRAHPWMKSYGLFQSTSGCNCTWTLVHAPPPSVASLQLFTFSLKPSLFSPWPSHLSLNSKDRTFLCFPLSRLKFSARGRVWSCYNLFITLGSEMTQRQVQMEVGGCARGPGGWRWMEWWWEERRGKNLKGWGCKAKHPPLNFTF